MSEVGERRSRAGRPRSEEKRGAILGKAYELVVARGYDAVTVSDIAAAAGTGKQTIYRWWPSKALLVLDALEAAGTTLVDHAPTGSATTPQMFFRRVCAAAGAAAPALRSLMAAAQSDTNLRGLLVARLIAHRRASLDKVLASAGICDAQQRERLVLALYGALWYRLLLDEPLDDGFADAMTALVVTKPAPQPLHPAAGPAQSRPHRPRAGCG